MVRSEQKSKGFFLIRPLSFLARWRPFPPYELICYALMFAAAFMFAYGLQAYSFLSIKIVFFTIGTLYCGFFAALIWNDITDKDIDTIVHPGRAIPSGVISSDKFFAIALIFSALTFLFAVLTSPWCLILVGATALFVAFHNKYLKKIVRFPAYSEIFTPVQWLTVPFFGFFAIWTALPPGGEINVTIPVLGYFSIGRTQILPMVLLVVFTYFADDAHDIAEGIHDVEGDRKQKVKTYATSFGEKNASKISFAMFFISGIFGLLLWFFTFLSLIFLVPFLISWIIMLVWCYSLVQAADNPQRKTLGKVIGKRGYDYLLFSYSLIFLDVFLQLLNSFYFHWFSSII